MPDGATTNENLGQLRDINRRKHARLHTLRFQCRLQCNAIHDRRKHAHRIADRPLYAASFCITVSPDVPSADDDHDLNPLLCDFRNALGNSKKNFLVNPLPLSGL